MTLKEAADAKNLQINQLQQQMEAQARQIATLQRDLNDALLLDMDNRPWMEHFRKAKQSVKTRINKNQNGKSDRKMEREKMRKNI